MKAFQPVTTKFSIDKNGNSSISVKFAGLKRARKFAGLKRARKFYPDDFQKEASQIQENHQLGKTEAIHMAIVLHVVNSPEFQWQWNISCIAMRSNSDATGFNFVQY